MDISQLIRKNIKSLKPYSSARDEYTGEALVYLDANEMPYNQPYNRYPDPLQYKVKEKISAIKHINADNIFLGNGSDEPIDLLIRAFCEPGIDNIITISPTYGMYQVAADINNIEVKKGALGENYEIIVDNILNIIDTQTKLIFLCSPNNPTGNSLSAEAMVKIIENFNGLVIIDEAYIDFVPEKSLLPKIENFKNLVVLQTFSKAWGMAGIRLGMAFANSEIIQVLNHIKYPYNLNILTQQKALELLANENLKNEWVQTINSEKQRLVTEIIKYPFVIKVYPSDANFILVKMFDAKGIYDYLIDKKIIVRNRSKVFLCENSLRITIGSENENSLLLKAFEELI